MPTLFDDLNPENVILGLEDVADELKKICTANDCVLDFLDGHRGLPGQGGLAIERKMTELFRCDWGRTALRNEASDATDLRTRGTQLLLDALVAAIDVVHTIDDGFAISYQCRQHE